MINDQLLEAIERYLNGEMKPAERKEFELLRKENGEVDKKVTEHHLFINLLKQYSQRVELENRLNAIHEEIDVHTLKENLMTHPLWIVQLWRNHHSKISVAASVTIFAVLSLLYITGKFNNDKKYSVVIQKLDRLERSNAKLDRSNHTNRSEKIMPDKPSGTGTGFAITSDGLIATNYHVINGADSVHLQNAGGQSFNAEVLYADPSHDIAILKIIDNSFTSLGTIPYSFKKTESPLAERVFTYGYPDGLPAYSNGAVSAQTGLQGDSTHYHVEMPIYSGNSGGPLWDSNGNVIGITDAKNYAIKTRYLLDAIKNIPADSLDNKVILNRKNALMPLKNDAQKVDKVKNYVFMVKVY